MMLLSWYVVHYFLHPTFTCQAYIHQYSSNIILFSREDHFQYQA